MRHGAFSGSFETELWIGAGAPIIPVAAGASLAGKLSSTAWSCFSSAGLLIIDPAPLAGRHRQRTRVGRSCAPQAQPTDRDGTARASAITGPEVTGWLVSAAL